MPSPACINGSPKIQLVAKGSGKNIGCTLLVGAITLLAPLWVPYVSVAASIDKECHFSQKKRNLFFLLHGEPVV